MLGNLNGLFLLVLIKSDSRVIILWRLIISNGFGVPIAYAANT